MTDKPIPLPRWCQPDTRAPIRYLIDECEWSKPPRVADIEEKEKRRVRDAA
jgi:hypothetical protein